MTKDEKSSFHKPIGGWMICEKALEGERLGSANNSWSHEITLLLLLKESLDFQLMRWGHSKFSCLGIIESWKSTFGGWNYGRTRWTPARSQFRVVPLFELVWTKRHVRVSSYFSFLWCPFVIFNPTLFSFTQNILEILVHSCHRLIVSVDSAGFDWNWEWKWNHSRLDLTCKDNFWY